VLTMATKDLTITITFAWWLRPYLATLITLCRIMGTIPDERQMEATILRAMRANVTSEPSEYSATPHHKITDRSQS